jgi:hypothetical protein
VKLGLRLSCEGVLLPTALEAARAATEAERAARRAAETELAELKKKLETP